MSETVVKAPDHVTDFISDITYERGVPEGIRYKYSEKTKIVRSAAPKLTVMIWDDAVTLDYGDYLIINPFIPFAIVPDTGAAPAPEATYELLSLRAVVNDADGKPLNCYMMSSSSYPVRGSDPEFPELDDIFRREATIMLSLPAESAMRSLQKSLQIYGLAKVLCALLLADMGWRETPSLRLQNWDLLEPTVGYVCANLERDLSLDEISSQVGLTSYYFSHKHKEIFNDAVMRSVNKLRLCKAVAMLTLGDQSVAQIASECGFTSVSTFGATFKKHYTVTPLAMRKHARLAQKRGQ
jgi:AraC-like DNA-binding protein